MSSPLKIAAILLLEERNCTTREAECVIQNFNLEDLPFTKANVREVVKHAMFDIELMRDKGRLKTPSYEGHAYFWSYKYRFWMRGDAHGNNYKGISIEKARRLIHQKFIENNLELSGETELHDKIINEVFSENGNDNPNYTQEKEGK